jgi:hypothetical protein
MFCLGSPTEHAPTLPTMCRSVTMAMKPRLPMITTCCSTGHNSREGKAVSNWNTQAGTEPGVRKVVLDVWSGHVYSQVRS